MGAGLQLWSRQAIVSTLYWHAAELLANGRVILVPFNDPEDIATAVTAIPQEAPLRRRRSTVNMATDSRQIRPLGALDGQHATFTILAELPAGLLHGL